MSVEREGNEKAKECLCGILLSAVGIISEYSNLWFPAFSVVGRFYGSFRR